MSGDGTMVIDDALDWFTYEGKWEDQHGDDPLWWHYSNSSYHSCDVQGGSMSIWWIGRDIEIYGGKRTTHTWFSTAIDSSGKIYNSSFANPDVPIQLLYASEGLQEGEHVLKLVNEQVYNGGDARGQGGKVIDFDFVRITGSPLPAPLWTATSTNTSTSTSTTSTPPSTAKPSLSTTSSSPSTTSSSSLHADGANTPISSNTVDVWSTATTPLGPHTEAAVIPTYAIMVGSAHERVGFSPWCLLSVGFLLVALFRR